MITTGPKPGQEEIPENLCYSSTLPGQGSTLPGKLVPFRARQYPSRQGSTLPGQAVKVPGSRPEEYDLAQKGTTR